MRAIIANESGGPEVLQLRDTAQPEPAPNELLISNTAIGVNFIEIYQRSGVYPVSFPFTPGTEAAGTVLAVGSDVTEFVPGDRVATVAGIATYAERCLVPASEAARVPDGIDMLTAGALPLQGCTAHYLANSVARPEQGDAVLVHAGAGGVGLILTQLLAARGVRVITTASTPEKQQRSLEAGAQASIGYDEFDDRVRELTGGDGVSVVYDGVGKDTFDRSLALLAVRGKLALFGGASGQVPPFDLQRLNAGGSLVVTRPSLPHFMRTADERRWRFGELFAAVADGSLKVQVGGEFALADAADAHRALAGRGTSGKLVLVP